VAIDLDEELKGCIQNIQKRIKEEALKLVEPENLHITLKFLGNIPDKDVSLLRKDLGFIKQPKFILDFSGIGVFPNKDFIKVVWIGMNESEELKTLAEAIERSCKPYATFQDKYTFSAHLTIARTRARPQFLLEKLQQMENIHIGRQKVGSFALKKSTLTPGGPIYENIEVYQLVG